MAAASARRWYVCGEAGGKFTECRITPPPKREMLAYSLDHYVDGVRRCCRQRAYVAGAQFHPALAESFDWGLENRHTSPEFPGVMGRDRPFSGRSSGLDF